MVKKLLIAAFIVLGLVYGSGHDLSSIKSIATNASNENARGLTANDHGNWGPDSGY